MQHEDDVSPHLGSYGGKKHRDVTFTLSSLSLHKDSNLFQCLKVLKDDTYFMLTRSQFFLSECSGESVSTAR